MLSKYAKGKISVFIDASKILISGDSDFEPLLRLMKKKYKKRCLVMATKHSISIELIRCAK